MRTALSPVSQRCAGNLSRRRGVTLIEVLASLMVLAVGMLAVLVLFPLGAIEVARAIKDDRAAQMASDAVDLSQAGMDLLSQTGDFIAASLLGDVDTKTAAKLRADYEDLADQAANLETQLQDIRPSITNPKVKRKVDELLKQIRSIQRNINTFVKLFRKLERANGQPGSPPVDQTFRALPETPAHDHPRGSVSGERRVRSHLDPVAT